MRLALVCEIHKIGKSEAAEEAIKRVRDLSVDKLVLAPPFPTFQAAQNADLHVEFVITRLVRGEFYDLAVVREFSKFFSTGWQFGQNQSDFHDSLCILALSLNQYHKTDVVS